MPETISQAYIFVPMLVVVLLTYIAMFRMVAARSKAMKEGTPMTYYRAHLGEPEPEYARAAARHLDNLLEGPTLFYAACLTAFVLSAVGFWTIVFAWSYVLFRVIQSVVHMTSNKVVFRGTAYSLGMLSLAALWINIGMTVFALV